MNNNHFDIEYSLDGVNFAKIATILGNGTTVNKHCYKYNTNSNIADVNYYRLIQVDHDGKSNVCQTKSIERCGNKSNNTILTNNGTKHLGVLVNCEEDSKIQLFVHNSLGQLLETKELEIKKGYNSLTVDLSNISNALYYVSVYKGNILQTSKKIVVTDTAN